MLKLVILTPKIVENICEIICILIAEKKYTSIFPDTPFGPDYCTSSKAFLTAASNQIYFQCILKIFLTFGWFFFISISLKKIYSFKFGFELTKWPDVAE